MSSRGSFGPRPGTRRSSPGATLGISVSLCAARRAIASVTGGGPSMLGLERNSPDAQARS